MTLLLLLACSADSPAPHDTSGAADSGDPAADTADTADDGSVSYRGTNTATLDTDVHYACTGFSAFRVALDGTVTGDAEAHCALPDDPETFQHLQGPIAGRSDAGVLTATWSVTACDAPVALALTGTVSAAEADASYVTDAPCAIRGSMAAEVR